MKVQLPVRWTDKKKIDDQEAYIRRLVEGEEAEAASKGEIEFVYGNIIMDVDDIRNYNDYDAEHCILRTYQDDSYCIAIPLDDLKRIMVELTGQSITVIRKQIVSEIPKKPKKKKGDTPPEDDLLLD
jgi:hypothetical protein